MEKIDLVRKIHTTNTKIVLAIAGGGAEVIGELLRHGQGSNTLLEAIVPYSQKAYEEFIGGTPDKFVSEDAAAQLAMAAWQRARHLDPESEVAGIGATCSLAKENEREGRVHKVWIARQSLTKCVTTGFEIADNREREEEIVANHIINEVAQACGINEHVNACAGSPTYLPDSAFNTYKVPAEISQVYTSYLDKSMGSGKLILPGSFNPFHDGHILMAKLAKELCPKEWLESDDRVHFEISVRNVDKPWLTYKAFHERNENFISIKFPAPGKPCPPFLGNLYFTNAPRFADKTVIFPGCIFVVGFDTFSRINDLKYYKSPNDFTNTLALFEQQGVKWIVFPRKKSDGTISTKLDVQNLPVAYNSVFIVPNEAYPEEIHDISSSVIRKNS